VYHQFQKTLIVWKSCGTNLQLTVYAVNRFKISQTDRVIQTRWRKSPDFPSLWLVHFGGWASFSEPYKPPLSNRGVLLQKTRAKTNTKLLICNDLQGYKNLFHFTSYFFDPTGLKQHINSK